MEVSHVKVGGIAVKFPVSHTIAHHETLEVGNPLARWQGSIDKTIDSQGELRHIDPSIGFS
jgi:hypothetical protein